MKQLNRVACQSDVAGMGHSSEALTNANMGLQDHADIISSISNRKCDRVLLGVFDQLHNLEMKRQESKTHITRGNS